MENSGKSEKPSYIIESYPIENVKLSYNYYLIYLIFKKLRLYDTLTSPDYPMDFRDLLGYGDVLFTKKETGSNDFDYKIMDRKDADSIKRGVIPKFLILQSIDKGCISKNSEGETLIFERRPITKEFATVGERTSAILYNFSQDTEIDYRYLLGLNFIRTGIQIRKSNRNLDLDSSIERLDHFEADGIKTYYTELIDKCRDPFSLLDFAEQNHIETKDVSLSAFTEAVVFLLSRSHRIPDYFWERQTQNRLSEAAEVLSSFSELLLKVAGVEPSQAPTKAEKLEADLKKTLRFSDRFADMIIRISQNFSELP